MKGQAVISAWPLGHHPKRSFKIPSMTDHKNATIGNALRIASSFVNFIFIR